MTYDDEHEHAAPRTARSGCSSRSRCSAPGPSGSSCATSTAVECSAALPIDRDHDHADEDLGEPERVRRLLDGADEQLAHPRDQRRSRRAASSDGAPARAPVRHRARAGVLPGPRRGAWCVRRLKSRLQEVGDEQHDRDLERQPALEQPPRARGDQAWSRDRVLDARRGTRAGMTRPDRREREQRRLPRRPRRGRTSGARGRMPPATIEAPSTEQARSR